MDLIPYVKIDNDWSLGDDIFVLAFSLMVRDGTLEDVFYDGGVKTAKDLQIMFQDSVNLPVFIVEDGSLLGIAWLNGLAGSSAMAHFCLYREVFGEKSLEIGNKMIDYLFDFPGEQGKLFDVLIGMIPSFNSKAINYVQKIGFVKVGEIPFVAHHKYKNKKYPMIITYRVR